ncbi:MAG: HXXEE domain-containing protein [Pseudomonadota bacterium]
MTADRIGLLCLITAFAMLWLPLGQHPFLLEHWMKVGTFMAPFLLLAAFSFGQGDARGLRFYALALLIAYIIHQFEEHWVDIYGNTYAFQGAVNDLLKAALGSPDSDVEILTRAGVLVINTSLVWLVGALAIWSASRHAFPTLAMAAIVLVNAFSHIGSAVVSQAYNPGLLTSILLFIPLSVTIYVLLLRQGLTNVFEVMVSIIWAVVAHVVMVGGLIITNWLMLVPEMVYFAALVLWSVVPMLVFRRQRQSV